MIGVDLFSMFSAVKNVLNKAAGAGEAKKVAKVGKDAINWQSGALPSLTKAIQPLIVDPRVLVSPTLATHEKLSPVISSMSANFAVYYFQAFNLIGNVNDIRVLKTLNDLSSIKRTDYSKVGSIALEEMTEDTFTFTRISEMSTEAIKVRNKGQKDPNSYKVDLGSEFTKQLNVGTGFVLNVRVNSNNAGDKEVTIPVNIRPSTTMVPFKIMRAILGADKLESGLLSRLDKLAAGEITFIKDFIFARDLIKQHKKILMTDGTGMYADVSTRVSEGLKRYVTKNIKGYGAYYNICIITADEARDIEASLGGKLLNSRFRNKLFARNFIMFLAVMDDARQTLTIYVRDLDSVNTVTYKSLSKDTSSTDFTDMFKRMAVGG